MHLSVLIGCVCALSAGCERLHSAPARDVTTTASTVSNASPTSDSTATTTPLLTQLADALTSNPQYVYFTAAMLGDRPSLRALKARGVDINARDPEVGQTALHEAVHARQHNAIRLLLEFGADVNVQTAGGSTPLYDAISLDAYDTARELLELKADPNIPEHVMRFSPLHVACSNNDTTSTRLLLHYKANPNAKNVRGITPLHLAVSLRGTENVRLLLDAGADPRIKSEAGNSALDVAKQRDNMGIRMLLERAMRK